MACTQEGQSPLVKQYDAPIGLEKISSWVISSPHLVPNPVFSGVLHDGSLILIDRSLLTINHFDRYGNIINTFGGEGRGPGEFIRVSYAAINPDGRIAVADNGNARLIIQNVFDESIVTEDFQPGWNPGLSWIEDGLVITNHPFAIMETHSGDILMHFYDPDTRVKEQFLHLELARDQPPDQISCTFCEFRFQDDLSFFTTPQDTSYRLFKKNPHTKETTLFTRSGVAAIEHSERELEELRERARREIGAMDYVPPTHKRRINDFFPDPHGRVWVLMNAPDGEPMHFDIFSQGADYIGSLDMPEGAETIEFVAGDQILFRYQSDDLDVWEGGLYRIVD
ncbi:MAG: hypothetical protein WD491_02255 [Balneolales bacterium]